MNDRLRSQLVVASLLIGVLLSAAVLAEAESNYATAVQAEESTARVAAVDQSEEGLSFRIDVENNLNRQVRVEYVHLRLTEGNESVSVSDPMFGRVIVPPDGGTVEAFVSARRHERLTPIEGPITVSGRIAVEVYNAHEFDIAIEESVVEP